MKNKFSKKHTNLLSKILFAWLLLMGSMLPVALRAQVKEVTIHVVYYTPKEAKGMTLEKLKKQKPQNGITVLSFDNPARAAEFHKKLKNNEIAESDYYNYTENIKVTESGMVVFTMNSNGAVVAVNPFNDSHEIEYLQGGMSCWIGLLNDMQTLKEVSKTEKRKPRKAKPVPSKRYGNFKTMPPHEYPIAEDWTRDNGRFVLAPQFIGLEDADTLCRWEPFVKEGEDFQKTQYRRMGYDFVNDTLAKYVEPGFMKSHEESTVTYSWAIEVPDGKHYKVLADKWVEDYNHPIKRDTIVLDEGLDQEPLRFLEFKVDGVKIKSHRYHIVTEAKDRKSELNLHFKFKVNDAALEEGDSINEQEKRRLSETFGMALNDANSTVDEVMIVGKSSPEGGYQHNLDLSTRRAAFIQNWVRSRFPNQFIRYKNPAAVVATWSEVADTLERQMGEFNKANDIRAIVRSTNGIEAQNRKVYALPYYESFIKPVVLPKFRVVSFSYTAIIKKLLSQHEVLYLYENDPDYRKRVKDPYEYEFLFEYLANKPKELEEMAQQAYSASHIREGNDESIQRPWPLAAYYLSNCLLARGAKNEKILNPYMSNQYPLDTMSFNKNNTRQWWNDEAIVMTQISNFCHKPREDYRKARILAYNYLKDDPKYDKLKSFLRCYGEEQDSIVREAVASSSPFNKLVIYAAQDARPDLWREALKVARDTTLIPQKDYRARYLEANLMFRLFAENDPSEVFQLTPFFPPEEDKKEVIPDSIKYAGMTEWQIAQEKMMDEMEAADERQKSPEEIEKERNKQWGYPMMEACQINESALGILKGDGYFDSRYRKAFYFVWESTKKGMTKEQIIEAWRKKPSIEKK